MKIAMIGQKGIPAQYGGVERHVEELSKRLVKQGHTVFVFCRPWYAPKKTHTQDGINLVYVPTIHSKHLDAILHTFLSLIKAAFMRVDVFHIHGVGPALFAWLPKLLRPSAKVIVTFHCQDQYHEKWGKFAKYMLALGERASCHFPDMTIVVSKHLQDYCRQTYKKETVRIPNGTTIPCEEITKEPLKNFGLIEQNYLLMCSRLVKHKGAHLLIEAWQNIQKKQPDLIKGKKLAIVGGSAFTEEYIKSLHEQAGKDASIVFTGPQTGKNLEALFAHCTFMIHPSWSEGMPIAIIEGMGYGKCVLGANIPENQELLEKYGLQFEQKNIEDLAEKIIFLLEHPEQAKELGKQARHYVAQQYDWDDIAQTVHHLYEWLWSYEEEEQWQREWKKIQ